MLDPSNEPKADLKPINKEPSQKSEETKENLCNKPHSEPGTAQSDSSIALEKKPCHLKLVVSNPEPLQEKALPPSKPAPSNAGFTANVQKMGSDLYQMKIDDPFHDLGCDLILEIERDTGEAHAVCHLPVFLNEPNKFLDEDEMLYGIIAVQFQMKILEQLFKFCVHYGTSRLIIYMDDDQAEGFKIYHNFLNHYDNTLIKNAKEAGIVVPTNQKIFNAWLIFMEKMNIKFGQDLWREQRSNIVIRSYLKSRPLG